jgi:hypothetical protein
VTCNPIRAIPRNSLLGDQEAKTRRFEHKRELQRITNERDIDMSDLIREIVRHYLSRQSRKQPELAHV